MEPITYEGLVKIKEEMQAKAKKTWISVGLSTCGIAAGARDTFFALRDEARNRKLPIEVKRCGCAGVCVQEPLVTVAVEGMPTVAYGKLSKDKVARLFDEHIIGKKVLEDMVVQTENPKQLKIHRRPVMSLYRVSLITRNLPMKPLLHN